MNVAELIVNELKNGSKTTWELEIKLKKTLGKCPDKLFNVLLILEKKGVVKRVYSKERRTFLWCLNEV